MTVHKVEVSRAYPDVELWLPVPKEVESVDDSGRTPRVRRYVANGHQASGDLVRVDTLLLAGARERLFSGLNGESWPGEVIGKIPVRVRGAGQPCDMEDDRRLLLQEIDAAATFRLTYGRTTDDHTAVNVRDVLDIATRKSSVRFEFRGSPGYGAYLGSPVFLFLCDHGGWLVPFADVERLIAKAR